jgi:hypothetical protein
VAYLLWYVLNLIPMPPPIRVVVTVVFVLIVLLCLLNYLPTGAVGHGRSF